MLNVRLKTQIFTLYEHEPSLTLNGTRQRSRDNTSGICNKNGECQHYICKCYYTSLKYQKNADVRNMVYRVIEKGFDYNTVCNNWQLYVRE